MIITIDGPAGVGKTTLAKNLARKLGITYLDSGALYRAVTWKVLKEGIKNEEDVKKLVKDLKVKISIEDKMRIWMDGEEITPQLRDPELTKEIWWVCRIKEVRDWVNNILREYSRNHDIVVEGRDMGTVVFPKAEYKIFLTASLDERAKRRWEEWKKEGVNVNLEEVKKEIELRDKRDSEREIAPLRKPPDAKVIDNSGLKQEETLEKALSFILKK
ncbi:MAG TPA: (d)CMP kinase [bacterium]|nr:(d)CMP kinase [bacterium]HEX68071.1 (d)CMP kinase [bacterium]